MEQIEVYISLLGIIIVVGILFHKWAVPSSLLLVIVGMFLSLVPNFPHIDLRPHIVLNFFLPLLLYETSAYSSWRDVKNNVRPIALLSIGHVIVITVLVAVAIHWLIPELGWAMAFVLGSVISPPDDVAIVSIAEKIHMPARIVTILKGEGMLNDATALVIFRLSLAAVVTHEFSAIEAVGTFVMIVVGETLYGIALGFIVGQIRMKIQDPILQMLISIMTPFLAYLPAEKLGGSGVLATVVTALVISQFFYPKFSPDVRLTGKSIWTTLGFAVQSLLFLLVGLELRFIIERIATIPASSLVLYGVVVVAVVVIGRFLCVYPFTYIPRFLFPSIRKKDPYPPWQHPLIVSWAGMRGGISLAAALAVPALPTTVFGANPRDLLVFLVFCVIMATLLLQGLTLPFLLSWLGVSSAKDREKSEQQLASIQAKIYINKAVLKWLKEYLQIAKSEERLCEAIKLRILEYKNHNRVLIELTKNLNFGLQMDDDEELRSAIFLSAQIIAVERKTVASLWKQNKIDFLLKNKLVEQLDHRSKNLP